MLMMGGKFQRIIAPSIPPQPGHPTSTGTTVDSPSLSVVIQVLVVSPTLVISSVEKSSGGMVRVLVMGFTTGPLVVVPPVVVDETVLSKVDDGPGGGVVPPVSAVEV